MTSASVGLSAHGIGGLISLVMPEHKALFRVDLDRGTVSAEAPDRRQSFFQCRHGFRLPLGPVRFHAEEAQGSIAMSPTAYLGASLKPLSFGISAALPA